MARPQEESHGFTKPVPGLNVRCNLMILLGLRECSQFRGFTGAGVSLDFPTSKLFNMNYLSGCFTVSQPDLSVLQGGGGGYVVFGRENGGWTEPGAPLKRHRG